MQITYPEFSFLFLIAPLFIAGIFGSIGKIFKGVGKTVIGAVKSIPVIGTAVTVAEGVLKTAVDVASGTTKRAEVAIQTQQAQEAQAFQAFQTQQAGAQSLAGGLQSILGNPILLVLITVVGVIVVPKLFKK